MNVTNFENNQQNFRELYPLKDDDSCGLSKAKRNETIENYLSNKLPQDKIDAFDEHTFYCETCFTELQFHQEMVEAIARKAEAPAKATSPAAQRPMGKFSLAGLLDALTPRRSVSFAFGLAMIVLLTVVGINYLQQDNLEEQRQLFAANADPYPRYERLIDNFRRAEAIAILSPENGFNCQDDLLFEWQREGEGILYIKILSNKDELLYRFTTKANRYLFENAGEKLQPGLYYWKLEDEDEMKFVGKFLVKKPMKLAE